LCPSLPLPALILEKLHYPLASSGMYYRGIQIATLGIALLIAGACQRIGGARAVLLAWILGAGQVFDGWRITDQDELNTTQWRIKLQARETQVQPPAPPTLDVTYTSAGMTMRHEKSIVTVNGSDQITDITVEGTKGTHSGTINITVNILDPSSTIIDQGTSTLPTGSGSYSVAVSLTNGNIAYGRAAKVEVIFAAG